MSFPNPGVADPVSIVVLLSRIGIPGTDVEVAAQAVAVRVILWIVRARVRWAEMLVETRIPIAVAVAVGAQIARVAQAVPVEVVL